MALKTKSGGLGTLRVLSQDRDLNYEVELEVMRSGLNNNRWDYRNVERYAGTFRGTPILCAYVDGQIGDGHNMAEVMTPDGKPRYSFTDPTAERIVGMIYDDPSAVHTEVRNGETWLIAKGKLWRFYHPELVDKIASQRKMEVSAETDIQQGHKDGDVEVFEAWKGLGVTILGDQVAPAIPGANIRALAAMRNQFQEMKLRAASYKHEKGVRVLSSKSLIKKLAAMFEGYRILGVNDAGTKVLMLDSNFAPCAYEIREDDHGVFIPERVVSIPLRARYAFGDEELEVDVSELLSDLVEEALKRAKDAEDSREVAKNELANLEAQLTAMSERENARRTKACEDAVKRELDTAQRNLSVDAALADDVLADIQSGKYMNSMNADGEWVGDAQAVDAFMAKVGRLQMNAAQEKAWLKTHYAWETGLAPNSSGGDDLAAAIARISD